MSKVLEAEQTDTGLGTFERYLSLWVALCMLGGVLVGKLLPGLVQGLRDIEFGEGSQINAPIAILIWLMITPMMMKVDFSAVRNVGKRPAGLLAVLLVNWVIKPFSMALLAWVFFRLVFSVYITPAEADQYIAGCIILAAAPCTAMVFVWSPPFVRSLHTTPLPYTAPRPDEAASNVLVSFRRRNVSREHEPEEHPREKRHREGF
jgi:ACR3 family arsenite transporter